MMKFIENIILRAHLREAGAYYDQCRERWRWGCEARNEQMERVIRFRESKIEEEIFEAVCQRVREEEREWHLAARRLDALNKALKS